MSRASRRAANRANAARSTGPADTSRTRFNGLAHGLTSKQTVIPGENQADYDAFQQDLRQNLKPGSAIETVLADRLIAAAWRLKRFTRIETAFFTNRIDAYLEANPQSDPDTALANLFVDPAETARLRLFLRYQTTVQREYDKAMKEFQLAKSERVKVELEQTALENLHPGHPATYTPEVVAVPVGFASQTGENFTMTLSNAA